MSKKIAKIPYTKQTTKIGYYKKKRTKQTNHPFLILFINAYKFVAGVFITHDKRKGVRVPSVDNKGKSYARVDTLIVQIEGQKLQEKDFKYIKKGLTQNEVNEIVDALNSKPDNITHYNTFKKYKNVRKPRKGSRKK